jgi:Peptidase S24-like
MFVQSNIALAEPLLETSHMMTEAADPPVYTALMRVKPESLTLGAWATRAGLARNIFNNIREHGNPKSDTLQKLLEVAGVSLGEFEAGLGPVHSEVRGAGPVGVRDIRKTFFGAEPLAMLPLYGSAMGGEFGDLEEHIELTELHLHEVLDYLARPASLAGDKDAYALTIVGDSMSPRFKPGERVAVSPKAALAIGDDVIVQLRNGNGEDERISMVLIKELVRRTASHVELRQYNPEVTFRVPIARVAALHKVRGHFF